MSNKMKGLLKGLRYISHMFEEDKEPDFKISNPTDVKHLSHIGWEGPTADSPSWMKEFKSPNGGYQSAPLGQPQHCEEDDDQVKWVSQDSKRSQKSASSPARDLTPDLQKSSSSRTSENPNDSPKKTDSSMKPRQSRRRPSRESKEISDGSARNPPPQGPESGSRLPDLPKKTRRKKPKDCDGGGSVRLRSRSKATASNGPRDSDPDPEEEAVSRSSSSLSIASSAPSINESRD